MSYIHAIIDPMSSNHRSNGAALLPSTLTQTIEDAVFVTSQLQLRYLWVDQVCIDQSNPAEKHQQIGTMKVICSSAMITLIAATGFDADSGLSGISKRAHYKQKSISMVKTTLYMTFLVTGSRMANGAKEDGPIRKRYAQLDGSISLALGFWSSATIRALSMNTTWRVHS
jgi:hypothetical protein